MGFRPLKSFIPTAHERLALDLPQLGGILLQHLKSYEGLNTVWQSAGLNRSYFLAMLENRNVGLGPLPPEPEYGVPQPEITQAMTEAWDWLEREGMLIRNPQQPTGDWFLISRSGEKLLQQYAREDYWEDLGVEKVKHDLLDGGRRWVGGTLENKEAAREWVRMKEGGTFLKPPAAGRQGILILISHRSKDESLARAVIDLLQSGLALPADRIRCTSVDGHRLPAGVNTADQLRDEIASAKVVIGLLTPNSLSSTYVLFELGARWGAKLFMIPLLAGVSPEEMRGPHSAFNALSCETEGQLLQLVEDTGRELGISPQSAASYFGHAVRVVSLSETIRRSVPHTVPAKRHSSVFCSLSQEIGEGPVPIKMNWLEGQRQSIGLPVVSSMILTAENEGDCTIKVVAFRLHKVEPTPGTPERIEHYASLSRSQTTSVKATVELIRALSQNAVPDFPRILGDYKIGMVLEYKQDGERFETEPEEIYLRLSCSQGTHYLHISPSFEKPSLPAVEHQEG